MNNARITVFDTTLRDGEQSPGCSMNTQEKVRLALQLDRLGVDVIEAGFPIASDGDFAAVQSVAAAAPRPIIAALARAAKHDIERAAQALKAAVRPRIHVFLATSDIHLQHKLRISRQQCLEQARDMVRLAKSFCNDIEFSPEDATRTAPEFLFQVLEAVIEAGATTVNIPDTVGYTVPSEFGALIQGIRQRVRGIEKAVISTHCHNDLGLAVANSLAAVTAGARQVECTINGLGERAGNASLEEIVMAVKTRADIFRISTGIDATQIVPTSKLVSTITGYPVQPNKAVVGANALAHESGIHQDGVLKHRETYEIMKASDVGWGANRLTLGKLSGRSAFKNRLQELGIPVASEDALNSAFARFKELADKKREIFDEDIQALFADESVAAEAEHYRLVSLVAHSETGEKPYARIVITDGGRERRAEARGDGQV